MILLSILDSPTSMKNTIVCRLAYLVNPKPDLSRAIGVETVSGHEAVRPVVVITPLRDYESAFEGWKCMWIAKAKQEFVSEFVANWSDDFPEFFAQLQQPMCFDRWWSISQIDVVEIDPAWKPS